MQATERSGSPLVRVARAVVPQWPFAAVSAAAAVAVMTVALGGLTRGLALLGGSLLLGSVLRFVLPAARAGLLATRRRGTDVIMLALLGLALLGLDLWLILGGS
jgi:hypothetical protein